MGEQITSSYNLFVDSSRSHTSGSKGDDFLINLQDAGVHAGEGEHIRMTLDNFSMAKVFTDVNVNNSHIRVRGKTNTTFWLTAAAGTPSYVDVNLTPKNYVSVHDLATEFKDKLITALNALQTLGTVSLVANSIQPANASDSTDGIIEFKLAYSGTQLTNNDAVFIQMFAEESDSYQLLGGDRIEGTSITTSSLKSVDATVDSTAKTITVKCRYPAQLTTMPYVYVRVPGVLNTNIETKGLKQHSDDHKSDTASSDILGRVVVSTPEWIQFTANTGSEFFLNIQQKQLNFVRIRLTDSRNRPIGRKTNSNTATGTATGTEQSTLGNLNFSAVIRFDIIKFRSVHHLETEHYQPNVPARFSKGVVTQLRDGKNTFFENPGLN